jgi:hypothetical protein
VEGGQGEVWKMIGLVDLGVLEEESDDHKWPPMDTNDFLFWRFEVGMAGSCSESVFDWAR